MNHFTIENETNNISVYGSAKEADAVPNSERFSSEAALLKLAATWPAARLGEIWNSLPGETPVKRFKDRATAVSRIWKAVQTLGQAEPVASQAECPTQPETVVSEVAEPATATDVSAQSQDVTLGEPGSTKKASRTKKTDTVQTGAPREGTKASQVIAMLKRPEGATVEEIMTAMKWQKHTTRALLSAGGSITKNHGLTVTSERTGGKRVYSIKA